MHVTCVDRAIKGQICKKKIINYDCDIRVCTAGPLIAEDQILQVMPSVLLSLHLLCERRTEDSHWRPYLDILPETYSTPLHFTAEDLKHLKGSPAQGQYQ